MTRKVCCWRPFLSVTLAVWLSQPSGWVLLYRRYAKANSWDKHARLVLRLFLLFPVCGGQDAFWCDFMGFCLCIKPPLLYLRRWSVLILFWFPGFSSSLCRTSSSVCLLLFSWFSFPFFFRVHLLKCGLSFGILSSYPGEKPPDVRFHSRNKPFHAFLALFYAV